MNNYSREWFEALSRQAISLAPLNNPQFPPSPYYRFLMLLAKEIKPALSVELGVCGGGGSLHLALGNPDGKVVGVDIAMPPAPQMETIGAMVNRDKFYIHIGDSAGSAPEVYKWYGQVDILFVDTTHTYEQTTRELVAWQPYLSERAVVCFDDLFRPEMAGYWESLPEPKVRLDKLHDGAEKGGGFGVIWKGD
jgi:predicted O-methyltransferase YrrM